MRSQPKALYHLQKIDLQIIHHHKRLQGIAVTLQDNAAVVAAQAQVDKVQQTLIPFASRVRDLEQEIQGNTQKSQSSEQRLYGGNVKNPKELQDLQQEIRSLKERNSVLEDRLLEVMMQIEDAEAILEECETNLADITAEWEQQHAELLDDQSASKTEIVILGKQREKAVGEVDDEHMKLYNSMKAKKGNQPVATMKGYTCGACGVEQTMALAQQVQHGKILTKCSSCGRILVEVRS